MSEEINYNDYEELIKAFWKANINQDYSNFDFNKAFESLENPFHSKVAEHGLLEFKDFVEIDNEFYDFDNLSEFEQKTDYIHITKEELKEVIQKYRFEKNKETFEDLSSITNLKEIYEKIQVAKNGELSQKENVLLFDEVIHAEHETGFVLDLDIEELRDLFEIELKGGKE